MSYQVPQHIDPNKVFLTNFSEVQGGRLDPVFIYSMKHKKQYNYTSKRLNKLVSFVTGGTPFKAKSEYWNGNIYWVSAKDFKSFYIDSSEDTITELGLKNSSSKLIPQNSLLMVVRSGILLHTLPIAINKCPVAINQDIKAFFIKDGQLNTQYLGYFFDVFNKYILSKIVKHSTTVQSVNTDELEKLEIPIPSLEIQQEIVALMDSAYAQKQQKEQLAETLLQSIDDYLLGELGIQRPEMKSQALQDRMFVVNSSEVSGGRFDPKLYSNAIKQLKQSLLTSPFEKQPLTLFIQSSCSGEWGKDETEEVDENKFTKCLVIRATEFDNTYNLCLDNSRVKYRWIDNSKLSRMNIQPNDLFIEKSGGSEDQPVGRISILTDDILANHQIAYSNFIHKITVEGINPMYLYFYLKTVHNMGVTDSMQSQTNGIRNLIMREYFDQTIVVPPLPKQQEIVNHITAIRKQAKALQEEGKNILEQVKRDVESMIIGRKGIDKEVLV